MLIRMGVLRQNLFRRLSGPLRESNAGPRPPEGRIIPLDQAALLLVFFRF